MPVTFIIFDKLKRPFVLFKVQGKIPAKARAIIITTTRTTTATQWRQKRFIMPKACNNKYKKIKNKQKTWDNNKLYYM